MCRERRNALDSFEVEAAAWKGRPLNGSHVGWSAWITPLLGPNPSNLSLFVIRTTDKNQCGVENKEHRWYDSINK